MRRLGADDWRLWRGIRLRALEESPDAFGSTLARELAFGESEWRMRASDSIVVLLDGEAVALGGSYGDPPGPLQVVAMWVAPEHRGRGLSTLVLDEIIASARAQGRDLELDVVRTNEVAWRVYLARGFRPTGETQRLRPGSELLAERMVRARVTDSCPPP
ncbi:GNAT family N-acetyltransferase [Myroides odoratimimus subsp. xuanwuensis]